MLNAIRHLNGPGLEQVLAREALALGPLDFCRLAVGELLDRISEDWARVALCLANEHMATAATKSTLMTLLRFGKQPGRG